MVDTVCWRLDGSVFEFWPSGKFPNVCEQFSSLVKWGQWNLVIRVVASDELKQLKCLAPKSCLHLCLTVKQDFLSFQGREFVAALLPVLLWLLFNRSVESSSLWSMDCSTPDFPVLYHLPELAQTHVRLVGDAINHLALCSPFSSCLQSFPASWSFLMSQLFSSSGQSIGVSASASVPPMNTQDWSQL